jgi:excisionase family DNA binding protein
MVNNMDNQVGGNSYSISEASNILKRSENTIRRWIKEGKLKAEKIGNAYRIDKESVNNLVNQVTNQVLTTDEKENVDEVVSLLKTRIKELQEDKAFLQNQVVSLTRQVEELTLRALPSPKKGFIERIKKWWSKE